MDASLRIHFPMLKSAYHDVVLAEVSSLDHYYTDGSSVGASFKLTFNNGPNVYIFSDGQYLGGSKLLRPIMDKWIGDVKALLNTNP